MMLRSTWCFVALLSLTMTTSSVGLAAEPSTSEPEQIFVPMSPERLGKLIEKLDPDASAGPNQWQFRINDRSLLVVFDATADRMRILTPITSADQLAPGLMLRMLQANFDAVLDVRYAVANGLIWSAFLHPLSPLNEEQLASAISQVFIAADTFGTTFISGAMQYQGGDSKGYHEDLERQLLDRLGPSI